MWRWRCQRERPDGRCRDEDQWRHWSPKHKMDTLTVFSRRKEVLIRLSQEIFSWLIHHSVIRNEIGEQWTEILFELWNRKKIWWPETAAMESHDFLSDFLFFPERSGNKLNLKIIYLVLATLGLHCCSWDFSSCSEWGLLCSCGAQASHCGGFSAQSTGSRRAGFRSCSTWASLLHGIWDLPGPGIELMSSALAARLLTTGSLETS